ncbi:universal stress protein [Streptomyces fradiae]|uniref:universal stress protein n=1 Tax=Streptomyces fradiae TaxID=1906 RepID=UPI0029429439|nr:universal stress protein [Streptomyces fradiae]WOI61640.1 universal stress protein [Streptomyces fradiae]
MSRTVTVGVDGSRESLAAVDWAAGEAVRRAVPLRLLHVWGGEDPRTHLVDQETARGWGERTLDAARRRLVRRHPDLRVETRWAAGDPVETLDAAAQESEVLVLGSRGLTGLRGFLAGSVSLAVLARVRRPVVLVRPHNSPAPAEGGPAEPVHGGPGEPDEGVLPAGEVVVGLDVFGPCDEVLGFAFAAAERFGCPLRAMHAWTVPAAVYGPDMGGALPMLLTELEEDARHALDEVLVPWTDKYPRVPVLRDCHQGRPAQDLADAAHDARLVVVGRKNRRARFGTHVGAVTHAVLHHSPAPVAVVPHD